MHFSPTPPGSVGVFFFILLKSGVSYTYMHALGEAYQLLIYEIIYLLHNFLLIATHREREGFVNA